MRIGIMPVNGLGTRFKSIHDFKPFANVPNYYEPMYIHSIKNCGVKVDKFIVIGNSEYRKSFQQFGDLEGFIEYIFVDGLTDGPLETILLASNKLNLDLNSEILIINCDQVVKWDGDQEIEKLKKSKASGGFPTIYRTSPRHSYALISDEVPNLVLRTREKEVLSNRATIGLYWFNKFSEFLSAAKLCKEKNDRAPNNEFYVSHVYNYLEGLVFQMPITVFYSLGEPDNYLKYLNCETQHD